MRPLDDEGDSPPQINILPAIDVIFAILAFFILSSLFLVRDEALPVNLPQADSAAPQEQQSVTVTIAANGSIAVDGIFLPLESVPDAVRQATAETAEPLVVVRADETVPHGRVVAVMDRLRQVEGVQLAIATTPPSPIFTAPAIAP